MKYDNVLALCYSQCMPVWYDRAVLLACMEAFKIYKAREGDSHVCKIQFILKNSKARHQPGLP
jgi:hypothetical protein